MKSVIKIALTLVIFVVSTGTFYAQKPTEAKLPAAATEQKDTPKVPEVTQEQKLTAALLAQRLNGNQTEMQLLQAKAQLLQIDSQRANEELDKLFASLQKDGYDLDKQTLVYTPKKKDIK